MTAESDVTGVAKEPGSTEAKLKFESGVGAWTAIIWVTALATWGLDNPEYVEIRRADSDASIGVFQVETQSESTYEVALSSAGPGLINPPRSGARLKVTAADKQRFDAHQKQRLRPSRQQTWIAFGCLAVAGAIQLSWDIGKLAALFHPPTWVTVLLVVAKYLLGIIGAVIALMQSYPRP